MKNRSRGVLAIYDRTHVEMSISVGRKYNNPLGRYAIDKFHEVAALRAGTRLLDIGAGRGYLAVYAAREYGVHVTGVELSPDMATEAVRRIRRGRLGDRVDIWVGDFRDWRGDSRRYSAVVALDTLGYFDDLPALLAQIEGACTAHPTLVLSDYFASDIRNPRVAALMRQWGVTVRGDFCFWREFLERRGYAIRHYENTTPRYYAHWKRVEERALRERAALTGRFGREAYGNFLRAARVILEAVEEEVYGHLFLVARRR